MRPIIKVINDYVHYININGRLSSLICDISLSTVPTISNTVKLHKQVRLGYEHNQDGNMIERLQLNDLKVKFARECHPNTVINQTDTR